MTIPSIVDLAPAPPAQTGSTASGTEGSDFSAELDKAGQAQESLKKPGKTEEKAPTQDVEEQPVAKEPAEAEPEPDVQEAAAAVAMVIPPVIPQQTQQEQTTTPPPVTQETTSVVESTQPVASGPPPVVDKAAAQPDAHRDAPSQDMPQAQQEAMPKTAATGATSREEATDFAKQVLDEANVILDKQQGTEQSGNVARAAQEAPEVQTEEAGKDVAVSDKAKEEKPVVQNHVSTAQISDDGKVEFKLASAQMPEAPEVRQKDGDSMLTRLIDQVRSAISKEKTEFFLQLKPEHLGGLSIMLTAEDKGMVAKLATSSQDVQNMLQSDMNQLQAALREKGINVVHMEVIYDQGMNSTAKDHSHSGQQQQSSTGNGHGRIPENLEGATAYYDTISYYEALAEQGGSVEFSA